MNDPTPIPAASGSPAPLTLVSLFCGAGGMDLGFEKAGFATRWANEYDRRISPSYRNHFPAVSFDGRSIVDIPSAEIPPADGVIGGPPCQSWSEAGAGRGFEDHRGRLFLEYIRVIDTVKPRFFVAENVSGILHARNRAAFDHIVGRLSSLGYTVSWKLLKASDYGVPQDRERVIVVGYRNDLGRAFEFPEPLRAKPTLRDAIGDLEGLPVGTGVSGFNHDISDVGFSPIFMSRNRVRGWDETSYTILASDRHAPLHPRAPRMVPTGEKDRMRFAPGAEHLYRRLTVRECARVQTFPDNYRFLYAHPRDGYRMVGNAVPVNLAYHIAERIRADLAALDVRSGAEPLARAA